MQAYSVRPMPISKPQQEFRQLTCWLRGLCSGRGGGKTRIGAVSILRTAKNGDSWMVVSPDNNMIRETTLPMFIEVGNFTEQLIRTVTSPTPRAWFRTLDGGTAEVVFKGAEVPDKLRGSNRSGIWFDEASIISEEAFQLGIATCRRNGVMGPCFATFTPRGFKHWTFERFYSRVADHDIAKLGDKVKWFQGRPYVAIPNTALVHSRTRDNPFLPQEFEATVGGNYSSILGMQELGGEFVEISGLIFRREWFRIVDEVPIDCARVRVWDKSATADAGCYTVGCLMARDKRGMYYVEDIVRGQWSYHDRNRIMYETSRRDYVKYGGTVATYIEQEGGGDGKVVMDQLLVMLSEFPVYRLSPRGGQQWKHKANLRLPGDAKVQRSLPFAAGAQAGNVCVLSAAWTSDFLEELTAFPEYAFADQVDASSYSYSLLAQQIPDHMYAERTVNTLDTSSKYGDSVKLESSARVLPSQLFKDL